MSYESMYDEIEYFIEEELRDFKDYPDCYLKEDIENNTIFLNSLTKKDIERIGNMILEDDELNSVLNSTIRFYLYHYNKEVN